MNLEVFRDVLTCKWPVGLMDKASASGAGDSRFESWAGHFIHELHGCADYSVSLASAVQAAVQHFPSLLACRAIHSPCDWSNS